MATQSAFPGIGLTLMPQLIQARNVNDDWTGVKDPAKRRKLQNRLNVRAHRYRKAVQTQAPPSTVSRTPEPGPRQSCWSEDVQIVFNVPTRMVDMMRRTKILLPSTPPGSSQPPTASIIFPLTSDHLITLIQYNVLRASMANLRLLSALHTVPKECSFALRIVPAPIYIFPAPDFQLPPSLYPTPLQQTVPHDKWINVIPHPQMRDNLISAAGNFDSLEMRRDLLGGLWEGIPDENRGLIAWETPWDINGWEVSEGFLRKWGWSLKGCDGVMEATNRWRALRGEDPLAVLL